MTEWLTEEEQYKEILNDIEISRIRDPKLREIRSRHWGNRHKIFLDERNIPDRELERVFNNDLKEEWKEIEEYRNGLK